MSNASLSKNSVGNTSAMAGQYHIYYRWRAIFEGYGTELFKIETSNWSKSGVQSLPLGGCNLLWRLSVQGACPKYQPVARY